MTIENLAATEDHGKQLIWRAVVALDEVCHAAFKAPIAPTFALRFVLTYLYTCSDGDRRPYDMFWKECRDPRIGETQARYCRGTYTRTAWNRIVAGLGIVQTIEFIDALAMVRQQKRSI